MNRSTLTLLAAGLLVGTSAQGAITYVDANTSNTFSAINSAITWNDGSAGSGDGTANNDGLWRYRGGFGGNGLWEATGSATQIENAAEIVTTATGLANGYYNVYVFFTAVEGVSGPSGGDEEFPIRAGLTSNPGGNQIFTQVVSGDTPGALVGTDASTLSFANTFNPGTATDGRTNYAGLLSTVAIVDNGTLSVYIDDLPASNDSDERTWYNGIGYEAVPEPSSLALLGLGGLCVLRRRRNA